MKNANCGVIHGRLRITTYLGIRPRVYAHTRIFVHYAPIFLRLREKAITPCEFPRLPSRMPFFWKRDRLYNLWRFRSVTLGRKDSVIRISLKIARLKESCVIRRDTPARVKV